MEPVDWKLSALISAEQHLLNAAGMARHAAGRLGGEPDLTPLRERIEDAAGALEEAAAEARRTKRALLDEIRSRQAGRAAA